MLEAWLSLKKTLQCKPQPNQVHDPKTIRHKIGNQRTKLCNLESSNAKDFIQGSKRHSKHEPSFRGEIDITSPITHEIVLDTSNNEICRCYPCPQSNSSSKRLEGSRRASRLTTSSRVTNPVVDYNEANVSSNTRMLVQMDSDGCPTLICNKCGEKLKNLDAVEAHHISEHSVTELLEEDSSRQIIETICGTGSVNSEIIMLGEIDCILKVLNIPKTFACFEEYREMVKAKADKLQRKHPRCVADGNELLRFHGTTIACSLGKNNGSYSLCTLDYCGVCQILRHGFSTNKEFQGSLGVYTTSTSGKAFDSISIMTSHERTFPRKSVIVCRVIAGRIYSPLEEKIDSEFDSLAEKINGHSDVEELYVLNPKAVLPCFVVIYKQQTAKSRRFNSRLRISSF